MDPFDTSAPFTTVTHWVMLAEEDYDNHGHILDKSIWFSKITDK